jgi:UPF0755 protein
VSFLNRCFAKLGWQHRGRNGKYKKKSLVAGKLRPFLFGIGIFFGVLSLLGGIALGLLFCPNQFDMAPKRLIYIPPDASARKVAEIVVSSDMTFSAPVFLLYARILGKSRSLRAGYYDMSPEWSLYTLLETLTSPTTHARLIRTTIPEGYSLRQIAVLLASKGIVSSDALETYWKSGVFSDYAEKYPYLGETASIEGYLFPDTYLFAPNSTPKAVTGMLLDAFDQKIYRLWESASSKNGLLRGFHDYLTLASLVEKEAVFRDEMSRIAGVFLNRLRLGMPLATDPTIVYAMGETWRPQILYKDLKIESPYNTYKYKGLPPTPIAAPGVAAFRAVLSAEQHDFLFFVALKNGGGRHIFTRSYREHLAAQGY